MTENESGHGWRWLLPISLVADVSAVLAVLSGSASTAALVIGVVTLLIGAGLVAAKIGKPVDKVVVLAVAGIIAGTATIAVVTTRALTATPARASDTTTSATSTTGTSSSTAAATITTTTAAAPSEEAPGIQRTSKDKPIQLTDGFGVDLDSKALGWGAARTSSPDASKHDLTYDGSYLWAAKDLAPVKADATLEDCITAGYDHVARYEEVTPGATFCVKTNGKSIARVHLAGVVPGDVLALDVLVWTPRT